MSRVDVRPCNHRRTCAGRMNIIYLHWCFWDRGNPECRAVFVKRLFCQVSDIRFWTVLHDLSLQFRMSRLNGTSSLCLAVGLEPALDNGSRVI